MNIRRRLARASLLAGAVASAGAVGAAEPSSADTNIPASVAASGSQFVVCGGPGTKYECAGAQVRTEAGAQTWHLQDAAAGCTSVFDPSALPSNGYRTITGRITSQMFYQVTQTSQGWVSMSPTTSAISANINKAPTSGYCSSAAWQKFSLGFDIKSVSRNYHLKINITSAQSGGGMAAISNNHEIYFDKNLWVA